MVGETTEKSSERSRHRKEYETYELDDVQCPECGTREKITKTEAQGKAQPIPPERRGSCNECGHSDHPLAFHHEFKWDAMSEDEREQAENARARAEGKMVDHAYSAHGIASRREP